MSAMDIHNSEDGDGELHRVTKDELPVLREWLEKHLPLSWKMYATARDILRNKWTGTTFYTLGWPGIKAVAEGPLDATCRIPEYYAGHRVTSLFSPSEEDAKTLITWPGFIDWTIPNVFMAVSPAMANVIESLSKKHSAEGDVTMRYPCRTMIAKPGELTSRPAPPGVIVRRLETEADIAWAKLNWPNSHNNSEVYTREMVRCFPSIVVLDKSGKYLGFEAGYEWGMMGMLYVIPEMRGQGLGSYITCQLAEEYFQEGLPAAVTVEIHNDPSIKMHERLGFKTVCDLEYVIHKVNVLGLARPETST